MRGQARESELSKGDDERSVLHRASLRELGAAPTSGSIAGPRTSADEILQMQRLAGNAAVASVLTSPMQEETTLNRFDFTATIRRTSNPQALGAFRDAAPGGESAEPELAEVEPPELAAVREPEEGGTVRIPNIDPKLPPAPFADAIASTMAFNPTVTQAAGNPAKAGDFGVTDASNFALSGITVTPSSGTFQVQARVDNPITYQVRTGGGPTGQTDIPSDSARAITKANYPDVAGDLTPDMSDLGGRPPRTDFYARDLTIVHERFHATDSQRFSKAAVTLEQNRLNAVTAASVADVQSLLNPVPGRVRTAMFAGMPYPAREERAYGDGAPLYTARADAIMDKGSKDVYK